MHTESESKSFVIEIGREEALYRESSQPVNIESPKVNAQLIDVSGDKVLAEINERIQRGGSAFLISAVVVMVGIVAGLATGSINPPLGLGIAVTLSLVGITLGLILHNKQQNERVTTITYKMDDTASKRFSDVCKAVEVLSSSHQVWLVETKSDTTDWKRNANATSLINRRTVQVGRMQAPFIKTNAEVLSIDTGSLKLFFFPDCMFSYRNSNYETIPYKSLRVTATTTRFIENERCPSDSEVVGRTWQRVNKDGGPDLRFKDNRQIPIILYGVLKIFSPQRLQLELQVSNKNAAFFFAQTINKELQDPSHSDQRARSEEGARGQSQHSKNTENIKSPYDILEIKKGASVDEISSAYHRLAHMYHPDKVTSLAPEFRELAERRMKEINAAFAAIKNEGRQTDTERGQREREQQTQQEQERRHREEELRQKTEEARKAKSGQETSSSASTRRQMAEISRRRRQEQARSDVEAAATWTVPRGSASESEKSETTAQQPVGLAYKLPSVNLLEAPYGSQQQDDDKLRGQATVIAEKLKEFGVIGHIHHIKPGPIVTIFEFKPDPGVKFARIADLSDDLCLSLKAESINVDRIPGKSTVGIEVPNLHREKVFLRELIESTKFQQSESKLMIALGKTMSGEDQIINLGKLPHLLIAGATGTGKSVMLNAIICSILYKASPEEVKFIMVDPKHVELGVYEGIPHLLTPIIADPKRAANALRWAVGEMEYRYREFATLGVADIEQYNRQVREMTHTVSVRDTAPSPLPYIVIAIEGFADLVMTARDEVENLIDQLTQKARPVGIHMVFVTQRPSVDVMTGPIKANIPSRIAFRMSSKIDSRTVIDSTGAETLLGDGDMLFLPSTSAQLIRAQGSYISHADIKCVTDYIRRQAAPAYNKQVVLGVREAQDADGLEGEQDELFDEALMIVIDMGRASTSVLQRRLSIGYGHAAILLDRMERSGFIGPAEGSKPRKILQAAYEFRERLGRMLEDEID